MFVWYTIHAQKCTYLQITFHSFLKLVIKTNCKIQWNSDLEIISKWAFQWKIIISKSQKSVFPIGKRKNYLPSIFNSKNVQSPASQKHLGLILDSKLDFNDHIGSRIIAPASSTSERGGILALLQMLEYFSSSSYLLSVKRFFDTT